MTAPPLRTMPVASPESLRNDRRSTDGALCTSPMQPLLPSTPHRRVRIDPDGRGAIAASEQESPTRDLAGVAHGKRKRGRRGTNSCLSSRHVYASYMHIRQLVNI